MSPRYARRIARNIPSPGIFDDPIGGKVGSLDFPQIPPQNTLKKNTEYALNTGALGLVFCYS